MKVSYNWLKDYCNFDTSIKDLSDKLTNAGLVVDEIKQIGDDYCLELEITSNRPDCLGIIGICREIRAITGLKLDIPHCKISKTKPQDDQLKISIMDKTLCPHYTAQIIERVKIAPSPLWLQKRLLTVGIRVVNNVVDITNYVLMECGQPLHAFDLDRLIGNEIIVRPAITGERIVTIDGTRHNLSSDMLIIADQKRPIAIAGVMGGIETAVTESTKAILLECARFEQTCIRKTSKQLGITSESSYRFERGVDPDGILWASTRAANLITEIAGGNVVGGIIDNNYEVQKENIVSLRIERLNNILGVVIDKESAKNILERLGFAVFFETDKSIEVTVPSYRSDVSREIDLIEEIARVYGYDRIPTKTSIPIVIAGKKKHELIPDNVRQLLTSLGLFEVLTYSIVEPPPFKFDVKVWAEDDCLMIKNPLVMQENRLRKTLLFNLLNTKKYNKDKGNNHVNIFEISNIYLPTRSSNLSLPGIKVGQDLKTDSKNLNYSPPAPLQRGRLPEEKRCLAILVEKEFLELKGVIESLLKMLAVKERCNWIYNSLSFFSKDKSAKLEIGNELLGFIGEINKELSLSYGLQSPSCYSEIDLDLLVVRSGDLSPFHELPVFPCIERDIAIIADEKVKWIDIEDCARSANISFLEKIEFFDIYRGKQIEAGKKGIAFSLKFRAYDRTLKGEEADEAVETILHNLYIKLGARLRDK